MGRVAVNSKSEKGIVKKLVYQSRRPFVIVKDTGFSSYLVRRYGKPNSAVQKFLAEDLYLLPKQILLIEHVDTPDMRYLNANFAPLQYPFVKTFDIEAYNTARYDDAPPSHAPVFIRNSSFPDLLLRTAKPLSQTYKQPASQPPSQNEAINVEKNTNDISNDHSDSDLVYEPVTPSEQITSITTEDSFKTAVINHNTLHNNICNSKDKLLFVRFTPSHTMRERWYLVQVDLDQPDDTDSGYYYCTFFQQHPKDDGLPDNNARWWPEWRELEWNSDRSSFEYGTRILFSPRRKADLSSFGKLGIGIKLDSTGIILVGPFDFIPRSPTTPEKSYIPNTAWAEPGKQCREQYITPPRLSSSTRQMIALASTYRIKLGPYKE